MSFPHFSGAVWFRRQNKPQQRSLWGLRFSTGPSDSSWDSVRQACSLFPAHLHVCVDMARCKSLQCKRQVAVLLRDSAGEVNWLRMALLAGWQGSTAQQCPCRSAFASLQTLSEASLPVSTTLQVCKYKHKMKRRLWKGRDLFSDRRDKLQSLSDQ